MSSIPEPARSTSTPPRSGTMSSIRTVRKPVPAIWWPRWPGAGRTGWGPFTILSCDNLPENGHRTRAAVVQLARQTNPGLADWIADTTAFPCSMVDRIVPATTEADIAALAAREGYHDAGMVKAEAFSQWVVEDRFCDRRPPLERAGVEMTLDVAPWETVKLRLLNGAHSALAYLGGLAGYTHVHDAIADPHLRVFVEALWDEVEPTLDRPDGFDAAGLSQGSAGALRQPGAGAPAAPDRHGRFPETAATLARHARRPASLRPPLAGP